MNYGDTMDNSENNDGYSSSKRLTEYFEAGCLCLIVGKIDQPKSTNLKERADYYMDNCNCSRHPESAKRDCWDKKVKVSNIEIASNRLDYQEEREQQIVAAEEAWFNDTYSHESRKAFGLANAFIEKVYDKHNIWLEKHKTQDDRRANSDKMLGDNAYDIKIIEEYIHKTDFHSIDITLFQENKPYILLYCQARSGVKRNEISIKNIYIHEPVIKSRVNEDAFILPNAESLVIKNIVSSMINYSLSFR